MIAIVRGRGLKANWSYVQRGTRTTPEGERREMVWHVVTAGPAKYARFRAGWARGIDYERAFIRRMGGAL